MKARELKELKSDELDQRIRETGLELRDLRLRHRTGEGADKPLRIRALRREIARMLTVKREAKS